MTGILASVEEALEAAKSIGLPIMLKATGGGGGIGIYICHTLEEVEKQFQVAGRQAQQFFGVAEVGLGWLCPYIRLGFERVCCNNIQTPTIDQHGNRPKSRLQRPCLIPNGRIVDQPGVANQASLCYSTKKRASQTWVGNRG